MRGEIKIVILSSLLWIASSQNVGVISFSLKPILNYFEIPMDALWLESFIASGTNIGMLIGAILSGAIADRFGRKKVIYVSTLIHSISTLLSALSPSAEVLAFFRFLIGVGVGGALPIIASLVAEYSSPMRRGKNISIVETFWAVGWLSAVLLSIIVYMDIEGWRYYMFISGSISLILVLISNIKVPESIRYLLSIGRKDDANILARIYGVTPPNITKVKFSVLQSVKILLNNEYRLSTLSLWITWFCITMGYYGIFIWLPSLLDSVSPEISLYMSSNRYIYLIVITLAQVPGYLSAVYLVDRVGRKKILSIYLFMTAVSSFLLANSRTVPELYISGFILSFFDLGAWAALYTYTPEQYPTYIRGLGSGWASSMGRLGGIMGTMIVPWIQVNGDWFNIFLLFAGVHVIGAISTLFGREYAKMEMPELIVNKA